MVAEMACRTRCISVLSCSSVPLLPLQRLPASDDITPVCPLSAVAQWATQHVTELLDYSPSKDVLQSDAKFTS